MEYFKGDNSKGTDTLKNILMTYMMYNFNLGYVQGMSDLVAPILMEVQDEVMAFWLFAKFMERIVSVVYGLTVSCSLHKLENQCYR
jgi:hypothetical protein